MCGHIMPRLQLIRLYGRKKYENISLMLYAWGIVVTRVGDFNLVVWQDTWSLEIG